ncbi:hypothetical protein LTR85_005457 [Meristemomyces frigidus]|nr:hypothetical protein LTR85_005457 [Meristemomyces frigidus]
MAPLTRSRARIFRFLDLPPELRNRIYSMVFEDNKPEEVNLLTVQTALVEPTITTLCRQVRHESIGLLRRAQSDFHSRHQFFVPVQGGYALHEREHGLRLVALASKVQVSNLQKFTFRVRAPEKDCPLVKTFAVEMARVARKRGVELANGRSLNLANCVRAFCDLMEYESMRRGFAGRYG